MHPCEEETTKNVVTSKQLSLDYIIVKDDYDYDCTILQITGRIFLKFQNNDGKFCFIKYVKVSILK